MTQPSSDKPESEEARTFVPQMPDKILAEIARISQDIPDGVEKIKYQAVLQHIAAFAIVNHKRTAVPECGTRNLKVRVTLGDYNGGNELYDVFMGDTFLGRYEQAIATPLANAIGTATGEYNADRYTPRPMRDQPTQATALSARPFITDKTSSEYVPLCDAHAASWFTERNHLKGGMDAECVVCAFEQPPSSIARSTTGERQAAMGRILLKYIDRLTDPVEGDPLEKIVSELDKDVHALWAAEQDTIRSASGKLP